MDRLIKFLRYPLAERWMLIKVSILLGLIRLALVLLPFHMVSKLAQQIKLGKPHSNAIDDLYVSRVLWAISKASDPILGDRACLTQALTGQVLLKQRGVSTQVRIGVLKDEGGLFRAHAWLEGNGRILIGSMGPDLKRYTILPDWDVV